MSERDVTRLAAHVLGVLVLVAAVSPFVVYAVPQAVGADDSYVVLSGSMTPKMHPGDAVIVREVPPATVERRDIITFHRGNGPPTTHRVVEVRETQDGVEFKTKGDANEDPDKGVVKSSQLVGKMVLVLPYIGYVIQFVNTRMGFLALVVAPLVLFVLSELWALVGSMNDSESPDAGTEPTTASAETASEAADATAETETETTVADVETVGADASDADAQATASADDAESEASGDSFVLTRSSLQLILLLLGIYTPYSGYVAYNNREAWALTVAIGSVIALVFALAIYVSSGNGTGTDAGAGDGGGAPTGVVRRGELPSTVEDLKTVSVESVESLIAMALDRNDCVVYDDDHGTYYLRDDDAVYLHRAAAETDGGVRDDDADWTWVDDEEGA
ncbi:MAG: signal peptidase I [Haloplanus sp.]